MTLLVEYATIHKYPGVPKMPKEYLTRCVIDPVKRCIYLYSSEGAEKTVNCETVEEFMNALEFVRNTVGENTLSYVNPL